MDPQDIAVKAMDAIINTGFVNNYSLPSVFYKNTGELIRLFTYLRYDIYYKYDVRPEDTHIGIITRICDMAIADLEKN